MTDKSRTFTLEVYNRDTLETVKKNAVLWYSHNSRDFVARVISWALKEGHAIEIYEDEKEGTASEKSS